MGNVLVTVVQGKRRRDLAVRSDVPVLDLLRPLAEAFAADPGTAGQGAHPSDGSLAPGAERQPGGDARKGLALAAVCGRALPVERSLEACGVGHGAVLVLLDAEPGAAPPRRAPARPPLAGGALER